MDETDELVQLKRDDLANLREKARSHDDLEAKLQEYERRDAFARAGLDPTDKKFAYFAKGYDGDLDPDKIRERAIEDGFLAPPGEGKQPPAEELRKLGAIAAAASGADPAAFTSFRDEVLKANSPEEVMSLAHKFNLPTVWNRSE